MPPKRKVTYYGPKFKFPKKAKANPPKRTYSNRVQLTRPLSFERKWYQVGFAGQTMNPGAPFVVNPFYLLGQGSSQDQRIGLTIQDVNLYVTVRYTSWGTNVSAAGKFDQTCFRSFVLANPAQWRQTVYNVPELNTAGTGTVMTTSNTFLDNGTDRQVISYLNKDVNKVLYDTGPLITPPRRSTCRSCQHNQRWDCDTEVYVEVG